MNKPYVQDDATTGTSDFDDKNVDPDDCFCESEGCDNMPLSEFDNYFLEGYSKKQERRVEKFLKENKFEEDPSKTTDEEKRKGYRRGTIETDILDENGKKKRVKFEMSPHDDEPGEFRRKADDSDYEIHMSKKAVSRKPAISNFIFKHEEGHLAFYLDKSSGKYVMEMDQIDKILTRLLHKMLTNKDEILVAHDKNLDEFFADKYAKEHSKYNKTSKLKINGEGIVGDVSTNKALKGLQALLHDDVYTRKNFKNSINSMATANAMDEMDKKRNELKREIINYKGLIDSKKRVIESAQETVNMVENYFRTLQQYLRSYEDELTRYKTTIKIAQEDASRIIKAYADDLNNELIIAKEKGRILSKTERRRKVDKMYRDIMSNIYHRSNVYVDRDKYVSYTVGDKWGSDYQKKLKEELDSYRSDIISTRKHLEDTGKDLVGVKADLSKLKNELNYLKNESDEISKKLDKYDKMLDDKKLMYNSDEFKRCLNRAKLLASKDIVNPFEHNASTTIRILMCLPKEERDRFAKEVHDLCVKYARSEREGTVTESYEPLSEFDHFFQEAKMKAKTRKELDDSDFALVYKDASGEKIRKYPINDEAHVKAAARMFPRGVPNKYRKEVAGKILRRAHKFGIDTSGWKSLNAANEKD